jgi:hypothetical protein
MDLLQYATLALSTLSLIVSMLAWNRGRVVYKIVTETDRSGNEKINELLKGGEYTILHVTPDPTNLLRKIYVLGKIPNPFKILDRK